MNKVICFDNGGESFDRYTILEKCSGDMIGASEHPFHPQGFGLYCGNVVDFYMAEHNLKWRPEVKKVISSLLKDHSHLGKKVELSSLSIDVQKFVECAFE